MSDPNRFDPTSPAARLADLHRQGFMKSAFATPKKPKKPEPPIVACDKCQDWHREGKHSKPRATAEASKINVGDVYDDFGRAWTVTAVRLKGKEIHVVHFTPDAFGKMGASMYRTFHPRDFEHMPKLNSGPAPIARARGRHRTGK